MRIAQMRNRLMNIAVGNFDNVKIYEPGDFGQLPDNDSEVQSILRSSSLENVLKVNFADSADWYYELDDQFRMKQPFRFLLLL